MADAVQHAPSEGDTESVAEHSVQETNATSPPPGSSQPPESAAGRTEESKECMDTPGAIDPGRLEWLSIQIELDDLLEERKTLHTEEEKEKAWADVSGMVKTYSDEMVERWNKVIDTYLVFAGLFSAILTAFNVQSYPLLQPPTLDPVTVLQQISLQLHSFAINSSFANSTAPSSAGPSPPHTASGPAAVPQSAIWLNILWFSGLIISLTSALLGILVKQWLNEFVSLGLSGNSREAARLRQYRLNNLVKWRVGDIVILIPVLLLISLGLFLAGLLVLIWTLHPGVAIIASVLVGVVGVITIGVTFLPLFNHTCAYLTPQTFALYSLWRHFKDFVLNAGHYSITIPISYFLWTIRKKIMSDDVKLHWRIIHRVLRAPSLFFARTPKTSPWHIHERRMINSLSDRLDLDILNQAYDCTLDGEAISAAAVCLLGEDCIRVLDYFKRFRETAKKRSLWNFPSNELLLYQSLLCAIQLDTMKFFQEDYESDPLVSSHWTREDHAWIWKDIPGGFLQALARHHTPSENAQRDLRAVWLQKAASWLEYRVLNPQTSKLKIPWGSPRNPWRIDFGPEELQLRPYCQGLSMEGDMTSHKMGLLWSASDTVIPSRHTFYSLHRQALRWFQFATHPLQLRDQMSCDAILPRLEAQLRYLQSIPEFLACSSCILSSSDLSGPPDHHVIRAQTFAVLSGLKHFLDFLCLEGPRKDLRHFSHEHLDSLSAVINGLAREHLVLFPLVQSQDKLYHGLGKFWDCVFWRVYKKSQLQRRKTLIDSGADMMLSLNNLKLAQDAYKYKYQSWQDARRRSSRPGRTPQGPDSDDSSQPPLLLPLPSPVRIRDEHNTSHIFEMIPIASSNSNRPSNSRRTRSKRARVTTLFQAVV